MIVDSIVRGIENPSWLSVILSYVGGVLASFTPCLYPMLPIVLGVIGASDIDKKRKALTLSFSFAFGLSLVYSALGAFAALSGGLFGEIATNPWSYLIFGNLCLILSFWMIGWINISLFSSIKASRRKGHVGVFITGALSGLVAAPCASPVLAGLLIYVANTKDVLLGGSMLLAFSLGMTTLLIAVGTFSGMAKTLPKPGEWMAWVKRALACMLFGLGEFYIIKAGGLLT